MLLAEGASTVPEVARTSVAPDTSLSELKQLAKKCVDRGVTLQDLEIDSMRAQTYLYDIPALHAVLGTSWEDLQQNFEKILVAVVRNSGSGPNGRMTLRS